MESFLRSLDGTDSRYLMLAGAFVAALVWRLTSDRYPGFRADELRLLLLAFLTAGGFYLGTSTDYFLLWIPWLLTVMHLDQHPLLFLFFSVWIAAYWISYSIIFHWVRWMRNEIFGDD